MTRLRACLYLAGAMILTGANVPIGKLLVASLPIYAFAFLRFVVASVLLAVLDHLGVLHNLLAGGVVRVAAAAPRGAHGTRDEEGERNDLDRSDAAHGGMTLLIATWGRPLSGSGGGRTCLAQEGSGAGSVVGATRPESCC